MVRTIGNYNRYVKNRGIYMVKKKKTSIRNWAVLIIILIIASVLVYLFLIRSNQSNYEEVEAKTGNIVTYYTFSGNVVAKNHESVISEKLMQISEIKVKNGNLVNEGDELIVTSTGDTIVANISGEVQGLSVEMNATVMAGVKLLDITDYNNLQVKIRVDEYDLPAIRIGQDTSIKINALNKDINGTIMDISKDGTIINNLTYFEASIDLQKDPSLKVGMSAEIKLLNSKADNVVILPMSVIQFNDDNSAYVLKEGQNGRPLIVDITTGINDGINVEIKSGVTSGEKVLYINNVITNLLQARPRNSTTGR